VKVKTKTVEEYRQRTDCTYVYSMTSSSCAVQYCMYCG